MRHLCILIILSLCGCRSTYVHNGYEIIHNSIIVENKLINNFDKKKCLIKGKITQKRKPIKAILNIKSKDTLLKLKVLKNGNFEQVLFSGVYELMIKSNQKPLCFKIVDTLKIESGETRNISIQLEGNIKTTEIVFKNKRDLNKHIKWENSNNCNL